MIYLQQLIEVHLLSSILQLEQMSPNDHQLHKVSGTPLLQDVSLFCVFFCLKAKTHMHPTTCFPLGNIAFIPSLFYNVLGELRHPQLL